MRRQAPWLLIALLAMTSARAAGDASALGPIERQLRSGDTIAAFASLQQRLDATPADAGLRFLKALILAELGRSSEAVSVLEALTLDFPELPEPFNNLAVLKAQAGKLDQARSLLESALRLDPHYRTAQENLGDVHLQLALQSYRAATPPQGSATLEKKLQLASKILLTP